MEEQRKRIPTHQAYTYLHAKQTSLKRRMKLSTNSRKSPLPFSILGSRAQLAYFSARSIAYNDEFAPDLMGHETFVLSRSNATGDTEQINDLPGFETT